MSSEDRPRSRQRTRAGLLWLLLAAPLPLAACSETRPGGAADQGAAPAGQGDASTARAGDPAAPPAPPPGLEAPPEPPGPSGPPSGPPGDGGPSRMMQAGLPQLSLEPVSESRQQASQRAYQQARKLAQGQGPGPAGPLRLAVFANPGNIEAWYELSTSLKLAGGSAESEQAWDILFQIKEAGCVRCLHLVRKAPYEAAWSDRKDDPRFLRLTSVETTSARPYTDTRALLARPGQPLEVPARLVGPTSRVTLVRRGEGGKKTEEVTGPKALNGALRAARATSWPKTQVACKDRCCWLVVDPNPVRPPTPPGSRLTRACYQLPADARAPLQLERLELIGGPPTTGTPAPRPADGGTSR